MIDPQQLERRPNCVVGLSSQCCSRHAGKNGLLCAVLLLGSLAHLVLLLHKACGDQNILGLITHIVPCLMGFPCLVASSNPRIFSVELPFVGFCHMFPI